MAGWKSRTVLVGAAAAVVLGWTCPRPGAVAERVTDPQRWIRQDGLDAVAGQLAGLVGWSALAWLTVGATLVSAGRLPGVAGRLADRVADRVLPATLRRVLTVALGLGMAAAGPGVASASGVPAAGTSGSAAVLIPAALTPWPPEETSALWTPPTHRTPPAARAAPDDAGAVDWPLADAVRPVTVGPGDSLWLIAARRLDEAATVSDVAEAWPEWYAANRAVIGPDPDRLRIGQRLAPP